MNNGEDNRDDLTLVDKNNDSVILQQNLESLIKDKNTAIESSAKALVSIPAALVKMKWQNRREIYAFQVKEEIYGAALVAIIARHPELKEKILADIEARYQHLYNREAATLQMTRRLADGDSNTASVILVTPDEPMPASVK